MLRPPSYQENIMKSQMSLASVKGSDLSSTDQPFFIKRNFEHSRAQKISIGSALHF